MALQKASIVWSAKQISSMVKNGKIDFNHISQRSFVWERARKSNLIESMILSYPIPQVFAKRLLGEDNKKGNSIYFVLDGKQRLSTVKEFLNDEFALTKLEPISYFDDELNEEVTLDISNKKFSDLPDGLKDLLNTVTFNIVYFDNLTKEEEKIMFRKLNNGKALSTKSKTLASAKDIETLLDIGSHELFNQMLSDKARDNKNQAVIVAKTLTMLNNDVGDISFASKVFNPQIEEMNISDTEKLELSKVFDYILNTHDELKENHEKDVAKKLFKETHFISLIPFVKISMENNINESMFADWLTNFFKVENNTDLYSEYIEACSNGIAKTPNIVARHNALNESYTEFFKKENSENVLTTTM